jgi:16S rRNA (guanine527-N7)-methyltransferase
MTDIPESVIASLNSLGVSRETQARLAKFVDLLSHWQKNVNLISPNTMTEIWARHILDSVQLLSLRPFARSWVDLGSGGGLPGLVIACVLVGRSDVKVHLVESNRKKAAFLRHASVALDLPTLVYDARIEDVVPKLPVPEIVTARALASLDELIGLSILLLKSGATGLFLKGRDVERELTDARKNWHFLNKLHPSVTDPSGRIVEVSMV